MTQEPAEAAPRPGVAETLAPGLVRVLAPNPSPMTLHGTNSYLLGETRLAVIDPGPADPLHLDALLAAIGGRPVSAIVVTHSHVDHSPLARPLARATGAPVLAFGDSAAGRSPVMQRLAAQGLAGGGEGVDPDFAPDETLSDGQILADDDWSLEALHTPGHMGNHLCLLWDRTLFSGDLVMGWASSLVSPPDGDLTDFMASLDRLSALDLTTCQSGHGAPIPDPQARIDWLRRHRLSREAQVLEALTPGPADLPTLTARVYTDIPPAMHPAAARNLLAHLVDLFGRGLVTATPHLAQDARFALARTP